MKEATIRRDIRDFLRMMGATIYDMEQNRPTRQTPGFSDLVVIGWGHIAFVEIKTPKGTLTTYQRTFQRAVEDNGGEHHIWRRIDDAVEWFEDVSGKVLT